MKYSDPPNWASFKTTKARNFNIKNRWKKSLHSTLQNLNLARNFSKFAQR